MRARPATTADAAVIARIYNDGIDDRVATFETGHRSADDVERWFDGRHPIVVVEYAAREARGRGAGRMAMNALMDAARAAGFWKLVSRVFPENAASLGLLRSVGFREVGRYERHAQLDGVWRDVIIVERLLGAG